MGNYAKTRSQKTRGLAAAGDARKKRAKKRVDRAIIRNRAHSESQRLPDGPRK
tara:strand:+ start:47783 stop:47941 length:159 start_codon:yes stop_codon:yes gene_type:complete